MVVAHKRASLQQNNKVNAGAMCYASERSNSFMLNATLIAVCIGNECSPFYARQQTHNIHICMVIASEALTAK